MMSSLHDVGSEATKNLKVLLTTCQDPIEAITTFQSSNAVKCPTLAPALKLLDLLDVRQTKYHQTVIVDMKERLLLRINELAALSNSGFVFLC